MCYFRTLKIKWKKLLSLKENKEISLKSLEMKNHWNNSLQQKIIIEEYEIYILAYYQHFYLKNWTLLKWEYRLHF